TTAAGYTCGVVSLFSTKAGTYPPSPSLPHNRGLYLVLMPRSSWGMDASLKARHNDNTSFEGK
ncbi:hypothetical protein K443DRAFT_100912, partial [Laccaria amethystina LaAM-08-1]